MAYRTSAEAVKGILADNYDTAIDLVPFIRTANILASQVAACATTRGSSLATAVLTEIETYLAAHFYGHGDQFYESRQTANARGTFRGQTAMSLDASLYGQTAKMLDTSGCLTALSKGSRKATSAWLGKPPSEQTAYVDRD